MLCWGWHETRRIEMNFLVEIRENGLLRARLLAEKLSFFVPFPRQKIGSRELVIRNFGVKLDLAALKAFTVENSRALTQFQNVF